MHDVNDVVLGIDIGGTNSQIGIVNRVGEIVAHKSIQTDSNKSFDEFLFRIKNAVIDLLPVHNTLIGIGIGAPNANYNTGYVESPPNLEWGTTDIKGKFFESFQVPVAITNDANAAALGEKLFGAAKNMKNFVMLTLGTGLGSGIVIDGNIVYGHTGFAGEIGHSTAIENGRDCGCGRKGCLETYASASGIVRTAFELLANQKDESELRGYRISQLNSKIIYEAAIRNDKLALDAFEYTGEILGKAIANVCAYLSPEAVILFGGLANAGDFLLSPTIKSLEKNVLNILQGKTKVLISELNEGDAAILGAAALILDEINDAS